MPRSTSYYGRKIGAVVHEARKGTVSSVTVGDVRRYTPSEQALMNGATLLYTPQVELVGTDAKRVALELSSLRLAAWKLGTPSWDAIGDYDVALYSKYHR